VGLNALKKENTVLMSSLMRSVAAAMRSFDECSKIRISNQGGAKQIFNKKLEERWIDIRLIGHVIPHRKHDLFHDTVVPCWVEKSLRRRLQVVEDNINKCLDAFLRNIQFSINAVIQ
jgi:CRISPR/Cas system type I-B associated protein Csh2 (Cas7 group RAMP superfamily)